MRVIQKSNGRSHWYIDQDTGERLTGVTTITGDGLPKKALINWAGDATAEYALDNWAALSKLSPAARLKKLQGGRYESKDEAANRGTAIHKMGERLIRGEKVVVPDVLQPYVNSYVRFMDEFQLRARWVEAVVYSETHRYCGQLDIFGDILLPDMPEYDDLPRDPDGFVCDVLLDAKSNRSGIFGETALQLSGYRWAEFMQPDGSDPATAFPMPEVTWTGAIWIRPDGYSLVPVETGPDQHRNFLYAQQIRAWDGDARDLIGLPIEPPTASAYTLTTVDGSPVWTDGQGDIAKRLQDIQADARCVSCGATLADCEASRGKDPTAPPWFGCCARGIDASTPCHHEVSKGALAALLGEIESGAVRQ